MWKDVPGWEDFYEANEYGEIRSKRTGQLICGDKNSCGYSRVTFYNGKDHERMFRHRLVAQMFIPNPNGYSEVHHIDENKDNNSVENLAWTTRTMNERENHRTLSKPYTPFTVWFKNGNIKSYEFATDLAEELGVTRRTIHNWLQGTSKGYEKYGIKELSYD